MTEERDISGYALPFTAAAALTVCCGGSPESNIFIFPTFLLAGLSAFTLMHPIHYSLSQKTLFTLMVVLASSIGLVCGFTSVMTGQSTNQDLGFPASAALQAGEWLRTQISLIPFSQSETNAVISALITGDKSTLSGSTIQAFRDSGASHILALSGLHLGIIYGILTWCLKPLGKTRRAIIIRSLIIVSSCGFYTLATGAGASITRALLFIIIGETARLHNRARSLRNTLMASLLIQTALSPEQTATPGFQLSYMAIAGIAYIHPWLKGLWPEGKDFPIMRKIWSSLSMSISCQITTAPIAYLYFHSFPVHFMLTNLIALPLTVIIIPASLVTIILSISGICPDILLNTTEALIILMTRALDIISSM